MDDRDGAWTVAHVDSLLRKLRTLYDGLPPEEQRVLELLIQQSQAAPEVAGYAGRRVVIAAGALGRARRS
jgi:hypothetical protein